MRKLVLHAAAIVQSGEMPLNWLWDAVDEVIAADEVKKPAGFLADRLTKFAGEAGKDFSAMRRAIEIPEGLLNPKPKGGA